MKVSMMTMIENDATIKSINAWIDYHKFIGIDEFFIYWNGIEDIDFIEKMIVDKKNVNIVPWPHFRENKQDVGNTDNQIKAMYHNLNFSKMLFDWTVYIDLDEYLIVRNKKLKDYLENLSSKDISAVVMFSSDAVIKSKEKSLIPVNDNEEIHFDDIKNTKVRKLEFKKQKVAAAKFLCRNIETTELCVHWPLACDKKIVRDNNQEEIYYLHFFNLSRFKGRANMNEFHISETNWPFEKKVGL